LGNGNFNFKKWEAQTFLAPTKRVKFKETLMCGRPQKKGHKFLKNLNKGKKEEVKN